MKKKAQFSAKSWKKGEETIHKTLQMPKLDMPCEAKVTKSHDEDHADEDSLDQWEK